MRSPPLALIDVGTSVSFTVARSVSGTGPAAVGSSTSRSASMLAKSLPSPIRTGKSVVLDRTVPPGRADRGGQQPGDLLLVQAGRTALARSTVT